MANNEESREVIRKEEANVDRASRSVEDSERMLEEQTIQQKLSMIQAEWNDDILPAIPNDSKYHYCWLSTTNPSDPIYRRLRVGYEIVKADEMPTFGEQNRIKSGEFEGCIAINEMVLAKIPLRLYDEIMRIVHFDRPNEEEELLKANIVKDEEDSSGKQLGKVEGEGFNKLGPKVGRPSFI